MDLVWSWLSISK